MGRPPECPDCGERVADPDDHAADCPSGYADGETLVEDAMARRAERKL